MAVEEEGVRKAVRDRYARLSRGEVCCGGSEMSCTPLKVADDVSIEAATVGAGCGAPLQELDLEEGQVVIDLGSGGGLDVFTASKFVGSSGHVIGIDSTPEMIWRARRTAKDHSYGNVEFRLGEIEHLPVDSGSADAVISNCVINLVPDKRTAFKEAYRVLRKGGSLAVSDIVTSHEMPERLHQNLDAWSACLSGALMEQDYLNAIRAAGFSDIEVKKRVPFAESNSEFNGFVSITITAKKP